MKHTHRILRSLLLECLLSAGLAVGILLVPAAGYSQPLSDDPTEWSLDELANYLVPRLDVLGAHTHRKGELMIAYQYMFMSMEGNREGEVTLSTDDVYSLGFMVSPLSMDMQMHMLDVMYAPSDNLTLMAMAPFIKLSMDHQTSPMMGNSVFTTEAEGIGDISISAMITFHRGNNSQYILSPGISLPTGSIEEIDFLANPMMGKQKLPYPMQVGSGTFDLLPGMMYTRQARNFEFGIQMRSSLRIGKNTQDYRLGNLYHAQGWFAYKLADWISPTLRLETSSIKNIEGQDGDLNPSMVPTADAKRRAGKFVDLWLGASIYSGRGALKGHRLSFEFGLPAYQAVSGPQLQKKSSLNIRISRVFE